MTPHFPASELACHCGCGTLPRRESVERLERVRVRLGRPLPLTSAARCARHNARVASSGDDGPHVEGRAFDVALRGGDAVQLIVIAREEGFTGFGVRQTGMGRFIHLDDCEATPKRPRPWIWSY